MMINCETGYIGINLMLFINGRTQPPTPNSGPDRQNITGLNSKAHS